jgi:glyoxylase-like metal-dependent hydrolase (beta-lactamase superfamily II)
VEIQRIVLPPGQCYALHGPDGVTLVDTGPPGSADAVLAAVGDAAVVRIVLTHAHGDHTGSVAELRARTGAEVVAHAADAPVVRGDTAAPPPVLIPAEEELFARLGGLLGAPPCPVDREVDEGDVLPGGLHVLHTPGHTAGSIAVHVPGARALFTGDTVAEHGGAVILGPFNQDRDRALASFARLTALDVDRAFVGHGEPVDAAGLRGAVPGPFAG